MKRVIIIDDEPKGRLALREKIKNYCPEVTVVAEAENGITGISIIEKYKPDIVFLDIEMPVMNGFEMLGKLSDRNFHLIFTTAYDHYAIKAIKYAAFDYLLKPVDIDELKTSIDKASASNLGKTNEQINVLYQNISHPKRLLNKLAIHTMDGLLFYDINDIVFLEASSNYSILHFADNSKITASKTLSNFEELLPVELFFRTHNSYLINMNYIKRYIKGDGGQVELKTGNFIDVSRRKKEEFLRLINY